MRAFRGKTMAQATEMLVKELFTQPHTEAALREHLADYRQHCIRWALEDLARGFEKDMGSPHFYRHARVADMVTAIRSSIGRYERGEL